MIDIAKDLQVGNVIGVFYGEGHPNTHLLHIRGIVDDEMVVFREWSSSQKCWFYSVEALRYFTQSNEGGHLRLCSIA